MSHLANWIARSTVLGVVLVTLAHTAGTVKSSSLVGVLDTGSCAQPCWHSIQPGTTTLSQAAQILRTDSRFHVNTDDLYELCWTSVEDQMWGGCATHLSSADP